MEERLTREKLKEYEACYSQVDQAVMEADNTKETISSRPSE